MPNVIDLSVEELADYGVEKLLQALLHRLGTQPPVELAQIPSEELEAELVRRAHGFYCPKKDSSRLRKLMNETARYFSISAVAILARNHTRTITEARHVFYCVAVGALNFGYKSLGREVGRDHTTIRHGVLRIQSVIAKNEDRGEYLAIAVGVLLEFAHKLVEDEPHQALAGPKCLARITPN